MPLLLTIQHYPIWRLLAALGCGLIGGIFFAFSSFIMGALARLGPSKGIAAMQSINLTVINPSFMAVFMGTALICLFLALSSLLKWQQPSSPRLLLGSLLYLVVTFGVTIFFNVPLNDALASADPASPEGVKLWDTYLSSWTIWNHVRTIGAIAAAAVFTLK